jgi:lysine-specific demethylase 8
MPIERRTLPTDPLEFQAILTAGKPVLFEGAVAKWRATQHWTSEYLISIAGDRQVNVSTSENRVHKGDPDRGHYVKSEMRTMSFADFLRKIEDSSASDWLYVHKHELHEALPEMRADVEIPEVLRTVEGLRILLWMGPRGSVTQLHHGLQENLFAQISGRKKVYLIDPYAAPPYYRFPIRSVGARASWHLSKVRPLDDIDHAAFPGFAEHELHEVIVHPGDMLYIPIFWWHEVHSLDQPSISLAYWWGTIPREQHDKIVRAITTFGELFEQLPPEWRRFSDFIVRRHVLDGRP